MPEKKPKRDRKPIAINLEYPVEYDGHTVETLIIHRPKGKHLKKYKDDSGMEGMLLLLCKIGEAKGTDWGVGLPNKFVDDMDGEDCITVSEQIGDFLLSGQKIGKL